MLNTEAHNARLSEALALLNAEIGDKVGPPAGRPGWVPLQTPAFASPLPAYACMPACLP